MSIAKEAQKSVSPVEWEMTCSRKPITCSVYFALAKKLLYLCKRDCGLASGDLAALPCWQFAVDLLARWLLQPVPPSRLSSTCGCRCSCWSGPYRCPASPLDRINRSLEQESASFPQKRHFSFLPVGLQIWFCGVVGKKEAEVLQGIQTGCNKVLCIPPGARRHPELTHREPKTEPLKQDLGGGLKPCAFICDKNQLLRDGGWGQDWD